MARLLRPREYSSTEMATKIGRGVRLKSQTKTVILNVYEYFKAMQRKSKTKGAFQKTLEATGTFYNDATGQ